MLSVVPAQCLGYFYTAKKFRTKVLGSVVIQLWNVQISYDT